LLFFQDEYDRINALYELEKEDLVELEARFKVLSEHYDAILEEKRQVDEAKRKKEEEFLMMNKAASKIQATWKNYCANKKLMKKGGKTAKKGKK